MRLDSSPEWQQGGISLFVLDTADVSETYVEWLNNSEINRFLESRFQIHTIETTRNFVESMLNSQANLLFGIWSLSLQRHVGNIKLGPIDNRHGLAEIGLMIGDSQAWGQGIGTDAITAVSNISRTQLGLRKITAGCYASNVGSSKAFLRAGFMVEAVRKDHFLLDGCTEDLVLLANFI
jgi:[ribosomal protein S5]-alanine N-acetyltransferase